MNTTKFSNELSTKSPSMCRLLSHNLHIPDNNDCVQKLMTDCTETDAEKR
jgi:hypothetical protein